MFEKRGKIWHKWFTDKNDKNWQLKNLMGYKKYPKIKGAKLGKNWQKCIKTQKWVNYGKEEQEHG